MNRLFVTGGGGLVGSRLLALAGRQGRAVTALLRGEPRSLPDGCTAVRGDLLRPASYAGALDGCETVLHLAALTGNAPSQRHFEVNLDGTQRLLAACAGAGVRRLLFVSTIAAKFPDKRRYPYAQAKSRAEGAVRAAGLSTLIARPTMVLGPGSPILAALTRLASLPLLPVFGNGRTRVQPIHVDDLAGRLLQLADSPFDGRTVELGGPEVLSIEELLRSLRRRVGKGEGPVVHVPMGPLLALLAPAEKLTRHRLPLTTGQLATFRFDGTAAGTAAEGLPLEVMLEPVPA